MTHDLFHATFVTAVLVFSFPGPAVAQINMQQMPGYPIGNSSSVAANRNRTDGPIALANSDLRVVPEDFAKLKLAPGFMVQLNVLDDSDFSGEFRIDEQGDITIPILGTLHFEGQTASEARAQITKRLLDGEILKDPQVTVTVIGYTAPQVTIIGEVAAPGKYPLLVPRNLVSALSLAGGPTVFAGDEVQITPASATSDPVLVHYSKASDPKAFENVIVHPGDTVQVKRAGIVYVLGAVNRPGGYVMQEDGTLNLLQAITLANGTSIAASTGTIYLLRRNVDGTEVDIALPFKKISRGKRADVRLQAKDVVFVPTNSVKSIFTSSQSVLSAAASASIYALAVY